MEPAAPLTRWIAVNPYYSGRRLGTYPTEALAWAAVNALTDTQRRKYDSPTGQGRLDVLMEYQFNRIVGMLQASDTEDDAEDIIYHVLGRN